MLPRLLSLPLPKLRLQRNPSRPPGLDRRLLAFLLGVALTGGAAQAALFENPDWKESEAPPPPKFEVSRMLEIDMPPQRELRYGVDPQTIRITGDGVVRYVAIATRGGGQRGPVNAFYEGLRCATGEVKTYARFTGDSWHEAKDPQWQDVGSLRSTHTLALARQAICRSAAPRDSVDEMVRLLKNQKPLD
ncbi:CNP1-like family protein [Variovorax dokdonensis]|uniref:CNP1-like family protein n=1 Tax=Variovorax dokdonensis TaxID=344883 RepID=A0ABT7N6V9_9BURK|nr:CNP1-like family protein [Variovorax dokdonensis]MDM0043674.1 CNP1-like family protein [Variovorax dokdonensis]